MRQAKKLEECSQRSKYKCQYFFKIIHSSVIKDGRLGIPKKFIRKFGKDLSDVAVLNVPSGKVWHVELKEADNQVWFWNGLQEFIDYHSISVGHFLVFRYDGNSCFDVVIFDMSACEIEYPLSSVDLEEPNHERGCGEAVNVESQEEDSVEILTDSPPHLAPAPAPAPTRRHYFLRSIAEKRTMATSDADSGFREQRKRSSAHLENPNSNPSCLARNKMKQEEYAEKTGILPDRNESIQVEKKKREVSNYMLEKNFEVVLVDTDSSSNNEPTMFTTPKSSSSMTNNVNQYPTKNMDHSLALAPSFQCIGDQLNGSQLKNSKTGKVESHCSKKVPRNKGVEPLSVAMMPVATQENGSAIVAARGFRSENPFCMVTMRPSYVSNFFILNVPSCFAKRYIKERVQTIILRVLDGRTWYARCSASQSCKLLGGWKEFVLENHLKEGDVCIFELVKSCPFELKVSIFRVVGNAVQHARGEAVIIE